MKKTLKVEVKKSIGFNAGQRKVVYTCPNVPSERQ